MKPITVARSWREFDKQQFVAISELIRVFSNRDLNIHININGKINESLFQRLNLGLPSNVKLHFYSNEFLNDVAKQYGIQDTSKFIEWEWIYHILLYYHLASKNVDYILTYDDDILFKTSSLGEVTHCIDHGIPFSIVDQHYDADKCMMGKLCETLGSWVADEYFACYSNNMPSNSGFMGFSTKIFEPFQSLSQIVSLFEFKKWDHKTMQGSSYDQYKILLQEQSFLGIMSRAISNRTHIVLGRDEGYFITSDPKEITTSKVSHYVGTLKYEEPYLKTIDILYDIYIVKY